MVNTQELSLLIQEAAALSNKSNWSKQDERRNAYLLSAISAVKAGASLVDIDRDRVNALAREHGLPVTRFGKAEDTQRETEWRGWQAFVEQRDMLEGAPMINHVGTYSQMGYFVPDGFYPQLFAALKAADPLFNDGDVTVIHDTTGRPLPIPVASDVENIAVVVGEHDQSNTEVDIASVSQKVLGAYSYITPRMVVSLEAFQDLPASFSAVSLFKRFVYDRVARGVSADMLNGNGVGKTLGLLPSLEALGTVPVVASGAFAVGEDFPDYTAANSIGPQDLANLLAALDPAYLASPKCAWLMNNSTLGFLNGLTDTIGRPIEIVKYFNGTPSIYGIPVKVSPSMPGIGVSQTPVILGALDYWITRLVVGEDSGIQVFSEAPGLAENGAVALRFFIRADGTLAFNDVNAPAPMVMLRNHS